MILSYVFLRDDSSTTSISEDAAKLQTRDDPISLFVTECLDLTLKEGIKQVSEQGGYDSLKRVGFEARFESTEGDAVYFIPPSDADGEDDFYKIPYYYHMSSANGCTQNCEIVNAVPALQKGQGVYSVEEEIELYIEREIYDCFDDFQVLSRQGFTIEETDKIDATVSINKKTTSVILDYDIIARRNDEIITLKRFGTNALVSLGEVYEVAKLITDFQQEYTFLENIIINVISSAGGINKPVPPIAESSFEFGDPGRVWTKETVEREVTKLMTTYMGAIRVYGTNNFQLIGDDEFESAILDRQLMIQLNDTYDLDVTFSYLDWWPMFFDLNCKGQTCKASSFSNMFILPFGFQRYNFYYSIGLPVLVRIHDPNAFKGEGLTYLFFLEANVKNNDPMREDGVYFSSIAGGGLSIEIEETFCGDGVQHWPNMRGTGGQNNTGNEECDDGNRRSGDGCSNECLLEVTTDYCGDGTQQEPNQFGQFEECDDGNFKNADSCNSNCEATHQPPSVIPEIYPTKFENFDNPLHYNSGVYSFIVRDRVTNRGVEDVAISFDCSGNTASLGKTDASGTLETKLPICIGGSLTYFKSGYGVATEFLSTELDETSPLAVAYLEPVVERTLSVRKQLFTKNVVTEDWGLSGVEEGVRRGEEAIIIMEQLNAGDDGVISVARYDEFTSKQTVNLVPGDYEVTTILISYNDILIPEKHEGSGKGAYTIPAVQFNETSPFVLANMEKKKFTLTRVLDDTENMTIVIPSFQLDDVPEDSRDISDLEVMDEMGQNLISNNLPSFGFRCKTSFGFGSC